MKILFSLQNLKKLTFLTILFTIYVEKIIAQKAGGGELNPGIYTNEKARKNFEDMRVGVSIHWGPNAIEGEEISWSRGKETPREKYDNLYKTFNPTKFNADEWARIMDAFGAKYIVVTTKHHDGFSMWHSDYSEYDIANTPFKRDYLKELSDACQRKNITFGTYYSTLDWFHPDYQPYGHGGPGTVFPTDKETPNFNRYLIYVKNQVRELIEKYNTKIIQFDGDWDKTWTHETGSDMYLYIRKIKDEIMVNNRTDKGRYSAPRFPDRGPWRADIYAGDFEERERLTTNLNDGSEQIEMLGKSPYPWQAWVTLDRSQWSWKEKFKFLTSEEVVIDLLKTVGDGGNYLINIGPRPDGAFEPAAVEVISKAGVWIKKHANAIYGTQGGPFVDEGKYTSTVKGKEINLFMLDKSINKMALKNSKQKIVSITDEKGKKVMFKQNGSEITFEAGDSADFIRYYKLVVN
jgi:alpha-L-fucosidase